MTDIFDVSLYALSVQDIGCHVGLMYTLFALKTLYGLYSGEIDREICLQLDRSKETTYLSMFDMFHVRQEQAEKLKSREITKEEILSNSGTITQYTQNKGQ